MKITSLLIILLPIITCNKLFAQKTVDKPMSILNGIGNDVLCLTKGIQTDYIAAGTWDRKVVVYKNDSNLTAVTTLDRHLAPVTALCFSRDGRVLMSGSNDNTIIMWDSIFRFKKMFEGHTGKINALLIDPSRRFLISGSEDRQIILWNIETGKLVKKVDNIFAVTAFAQSNDIRSLYVSGNEPTIKQYAIGSWQVSRSFLGHTDVVNDIAISPNNKYMISGSNDKTARIWDLQTGKELRKLAVDCWKVQAVAFSRDSRFAATGCNDGSIKVWEVETGKLIANILSEGENIKSVVFSKFANQLISASILRNRNDYGLRIWPTYIAVIQPSNTPLSQDSTTKNAKQPELVAPKTQVKPQTPAPRK